MGANRFYDFLLIHKYIGITRMTSIERESRMYKRALFNVPYKFIEVRHERAGDFIAQLAGAEPMVMWLDYDGGISPEVTRDIMALSTKLRVGDFCFVTVYGGPPRLLEGLNDEARLAWLQDNMREVAGKVTLADCERDNFSDAVHKMLVSAFQNAFVMRRDGTFRTLLQVEYSDTTPMVTVGGALLGDGQNFTMAEKMRAKLPFLDPIPGNLYSIRSLHLTERERGLFDRATTQKSKRSKEYNQLKDMGFKEADIESYRELLRYLPRYVETIV